MTLRPLLSPLLLAGLALPAGAAVPDLTELSLEQLLNVEITSASRFAQKASEAPSSVTVLKAEDFRNFGWRTLADALDSVRGFTTSSNHIYRFAGTRGFGPPGDYNSRILVLVDGVRTNDMVYDQAYLGNEFILDVDLIDQIEIVRGPSSPVYGGNAFFGVINVITKRGKDFSGGEVAASQGSARTGEGRLTVGQQLENGLDFVLSATGLDRGGQSYRFPEFDARSNRRLDREGSEKLFGKLSFGDFAVEGATSRRRKDDPSAAYGTAFNVPGSRSTDEQAFLDGRYQTQLNRDLGFSSRLYYNQYDFTEDLVFTSTTPPPGRYTDRSTGKGRWWGGEAKFQYSGRDAHQIVFGLDYQQNTHQDQRYFTLGGPTVLDAPLSSWRYGIYGVDEITLSPAWMLNLGARFDHHSNSGDHVSPRLASIHKVEPDATLKLLYGSAYRAPTAYEVNYASPTPQWIGNSSLKSETIDTYEAVWEQYLNPTRRLTVSAFHYLIRNWIVQGMNGAAIQFVNSQPVSGDGLDFEIEQRFANNAQLRASYTRQWTPARPDGNLNLNPRNIAKLNLATPVPGARNLKAGLEAQLVDRRPTPSGSAGAYAVANATLRWLPGGERGPEIAASLYNLFDRRWLAVFPDVMENGAVRETLAQDGRTFRLKVTYPF